VESRENQVACLRRFHPDFDGFLIAHFSHQNHFWSLAQGRTQRQSEARSVAVEFALMNRGLFVQVKKLDGILDGQDVVCLILVDFVQDSGQG